MRLRRSKATIIDVRLGKTTVTFVYVWAIIVIVVIIIIQWIETAVINCWRIKSSVISISFGKYKRIFWNRIVVTSS